MFEKENFLEIIVVLLITQHLKKKNIKVFAISKCDLLKNYPREEKTKSY